MMLIIYLNRVLSIHFLLYIYKLKLSSLDKLEATFLNP
jgi:hypothetical protein